MDLLVFMVPLFLSYYEVLGCLPFIGFWIVAFPTLLYSSIQLKMIRTCHSVMFYFMKKILFILAGSEFYQI